MGAGDRSNRRKEIDRLEVEKENVTASLLAGPPRDVRSVCADGAIAIRIILHTDDNGARGVKTESGQCGDWTGPSALGHMELDGTG